MTSGRRVLGLLIAAVVIIVVGVWLSSRKVRIDDSVAGMPVLNGLKTQLNDVTEVRIAKGDGSRATLRKQPGGWLVGEREYPADTAKVRKLLIDLSSLQSVEAKTSDPEKYALLGVEDVNKPTAAGTRIEMVTPKQTHAVIIGKASGAKSGYVRVADAKQSELASPLIEASADPKQWLDTNLLDIPEARVKEVDVAPAGSPAYKVSREKKEQTDFSVTGVPKGRELSSPSAGNAYGSALTLLTLTDVKKAPSGDAAASAGSAPAAAGASGTGTAKTTDAKARAGAKEGSAAAPRVTFRTFDGLELQITGQVDGDHRLISIVPQSTAKETADEAQKLDARVKGWQFEIPTYKYDALFRPLEDLLKKPETKTDTKASTKPGAKKIGAKPAEPALPSSPAK
jgi:hypothetical protein